MVHPYTLDELTFSSFFYQNEHENIGWGAYLHFSLDNVKPFVPITIPPIY